MIFLTGGFRYDLPDARLRRRPASADFRFPGLIETRHTVETSNVADCHCGYSGRHMG